jgi:adenylyltransferase/sulfurtransferase
VLGVLPGIIGTIQATETIKLLLGIGQPLIGRLLLFDALRMQVRTMQLRKDPACPACGTREIRELIDYEEFCGIRQAAVAEAGNTVPEIVPRELAERMRAGDDLVLIDVREPHEWEIARIAGAQLIPMATLAGALSELDASRDIVVHCKVGSRSAKAVRQLQAAGFKRVWSLTGGIQRWSDDVDPTVARY